MNTKNKKGFSLVEILIVVAIIGILMAIMLPVYKGIAMKGRAVKCQSNLKNLYTATMLKVKDNGYFPYAFSYVERTESEYVPGYYEYEGHKGWVDWSANEWADGLTWKETWHKVRDNLGLGVTLWSGDGGYYSVTNGSIWNYTGKSIESYGCPEFKVLKLSETVPPGNEKVYRTYVFNRRLNARKLSDLSKISSTLMFGEGSVDVLTASDGGDETGFNGENENQWDGCFTPGKWDENHYEAGNNNEVLGQYHKDDTSFIVFCDGHIEKLRKPTDQDVLFDLCEGQFLDREDF